ncbi:TPM domain-containing protein [Pleurocapsales cyanobacterium LEGE 06147]|nr:TPM domain-containing protein [Pleurocapsales cyanobacterium LEGE 06147]
MKQNYIWLRRTRTLLKSLVISILSIILTTMLVAAPAVATGVYDLPNPNTSDVWIVDQADEISFANQSKLSKAFKKLAEETGQELRMVAIRRLDYGETIDSFADELFTTWYQTPEAQANQTLLVLDTLTNNVAIRTGEIAKELVNEEIAESVIAETVGYDLRKGNKYNQAFLDASDRLIAVLAGEPDPGPPAITEEIQVEGTFTKAEDTNTDNATIWVVVLLVLATVIPMVTYFWYVGFPGR